MDFTLNEEQQAIAELADKILGDLCPPEKLRLHEATDDPILTAAWSELAKADLVSVALPESAGGGGYGILEACMVAEKVGRHVAPVPYASTLASAIVLGELGVTDALAGVADGSAVLTAALSEGGAESPEIPATSAAAGGDSWQLTGEKRFVPFAGQAAAILVPARVGEGDVALFLVDPSTSGVRIHEEDALWGLPQATVELDGASAMRVGDADAVTRLIEVSTALACATVTGVCEGALRITAAYVSEREQFGAKIGTFQAVAQRIADSYIDTEGVRLTTLHAAWRLGAGLLASDELHIAKWWAAEAGHRVVHAAQHLHGGVGVDVDYPIHRYFRWAKTLELQLGSASEHLRRLGQAIAAEPI